MGCHLLALPLFALCRVCMSLKHFYGRFNWSWNWLHTNSCRVEFLSECISNTVALPAATPSLVRRSLLLWTSLQACALQGGSPGGSPGTPAGLCAGAGGGGRERGVRALLRGSGLTSKALILFLPNELSHFLCLAAPSASLHCGHSSHEPASRAAAAAAGGPILGPPTMAFSRPRREGGGGGPGLAPATC